MAFRAWTGGSFAFLLQYGYSPIYTLRLNLRHRHVVDPVLDEIKGARILDLGSHDGRWPMAFADAGASVVCGIEGRQTLVDKFHSQNRERYQDRVVIEVGDFVDVMDRMIAAGKTFDIVACLGVFYHTMHHYKLICQMAKLEPRLVIIDSEFSRAKAPIISMVKENPEKDLNTIAQIDGQDFVPIGIPSLRAVQIMAESVGYRMSQVPWKVPIDERGPVPDYFDKWPDRVRGTVHLRPF